MIRLHHDVEDNEIGCGHRQLDQAVRAVGGFFDLRDAHPAEHAGDECPHEGYVVDDEDLEVAQTRIGHRFLVVRPC